MMSKYIKYRFCEIELVKDITTPTNLIFHHDDSDPEFLFYEDVPEKVSFGFCDLVVKYKDKVIGTLSNGELSEELVKSYINSFNIRDTMKTVEIKINIISSVDDLTKEEFDEAYSVFEKTDESKFDLPESISSPFFMWGSYTAQGRKELEKYDKHLSDENGKLVYRIIKEKKYTREDLVNTARWAFHFYKGDQSLSDYEMEEKFEELLLGK